VFQLRPATDPAESN